MDGKYSRTRRSRSVKCDSITCIYIEKKKTPPELQLIFLILVFPQKCCRFRAIATLVSRTSFMSALQQGARTSNARSTGLSVPARTQSFSSARLSALLPRWRTAVKKKNQKNNNNKNKKANTSSNSTEICSVTFHKFKCQ